MKVWPWNIWCWIVWLVSALFLHCAPACVVVDAHTHAVPFLCWAPCVHQSWPVTFCELTRFWSPLPSRFSFWRIHSVFYLRRRDTGVDLPLRGAIILGSCSAMQFFRCATLPNLSHKTLKLNFTKQSENSTVHSHTHKHTHAHRYTLDVQTCF